MVYVLSTHASGILVGAVVAYVAAAFWYSPKLFGNLWAAEQPHRRMPEDFQSGMKTGMAASAVDAVVTAALVALLWVSYGSAGVLLLAAAVIVGTFSGNVFKGGSLRLWMIDAGCLVMQIGLMTGALALL